MPAGKHTISFQSHVFIKSPLIRTHVERLEIGCSSMTRPGTSLNKVSIKDRVRAEPSAVVAVAPGLCDDLLSLVAGIRVSKRTVFEET
jgi:hypothetical protein